MSKEQSDLLARFEELLDKKLVPLTQKLSKIQDEICSMKEEHKAEIDDLRGRILFLEEKLDYQENQDRRMNLIFGGIPETDGETWLEVRKKIVSTLANHGVKDVQEDDLQRCHRLNSKQRPRMIIAKFKDFHTKDQVLREGRTNFKNTSFMVKEDFSQRVRTSRRALRPFQQAAFDARLKTFFRKDRLIVEGCVLEYNHHDACILGTLDDGTKKKFEHVDDILNLTSNRKRHRAFVSSPGYAAASTRPRLVSDEH